MTLYLDTSAMVSLFLDENRTPTVQKVVMGAPRDIAISDLAKGEFSAAISTNVRIGRLTADQGVFAIEGADIWGSDMVRHDVTPDDMIEAMALVRRFDLGLLFPDALHLAICRRTGSTLVTGDRQQADAAETLGLALIRV